MWNRVHEAPIPFQSQQGGMSCGAVLGVQPTAESGGGGRGRGQRARFVSFASAVREIQIL